MNASPSFLSRFTQGHRLWLTLLVLLGVLVLIRLGFWQLQRRAERLQRNATFAARTTEPPIRLEEIAGDPARFEYRQTLLEGTWEYGYEVVLLGGTRGDTPGVHLITPLRLAGSDRAVLVDRGWIPYAQRDPAARAQFRGPAKAAMRGRVRLSRRRTGSPGREEASGAIQERRDAWSSVDVPAIQAQVPFPLLPIYVEQLPEPDAPELPWRDTEIVLDEGPHLSYAIQWFAFSVILLVGYGAVMATRPVGPRHTVSRGI